MTVPEAVGDVSVRCMCCGTSGVGVLTDTGEHALGRERLELGRDGRGAGVAVAADEGGDQPSDVGGGLRM